MIPFLRTLPLAGLLLFTGCDGPPPPDVAESIEAAEAAEAAPVEAAPAEEQETDPTIDLEDASLHQEDGIRVGRFSNRYPARSGYAIEARTAGIPADAAGVHWFVYLNDEKKGVAYHLAERAPYRYPGEKLAQVPTGGPHRLVAQVWDADRNEVASADTYFSVVRIPSPVSPPKVADPVGQLDPQAALFRLLPYAQHGLSARPPSRAVGARLTLQDGREVSTGDPEALKAWREVVKKRYGGDPWMRQ